MHRVSGNMLPDPPFRMNSGIAASNLRLNSRSRTSPPLSSSKLTRSREYLQTLASSNGKVAPQFEILQENLSQLELKFHLASKRLQEEAESHAKDREKLRSLETECDRLRLVVDDLELRRINMREVATQATCAPPPIIGISRLNRKNCHVLRPIENLLTSKQPPSSPVKTVNATPVKMTQSPVVSIQTPVRESSPKLHRVETIINRFGENRQKPPIPRKSGTGDRGHLSRNALIIQGLIEDLVEEGSETVSNICCHFDRLDGSKSGLLSRDLSLVLISLLLEEKGVRHCNIPKVICSKLLKEVINSKSSFIDLAATPGSESNRPVVCLRRDHVIDFSKLAFEFILDQERS